MKYRAPLLWAKLPEEHKTATSLNDLKTKIKKRNERYALVSYAGLTNIRFRISI